MIFLQLFYEFFKIGLFAVGGGMATIPFLMDLTSRYSWFTMADLTNMIAVSESTPGPIGINMATYAGFNAAGIPGALCATLSLVLPAWIIIILIAKFMSSFSENKYVKGAFYGIRPMIAALIGYAVWQIAVITFADTSGPTILFHYDAIVICTLLLLLFQWKPCKKIHPIFWIACGAVLGNILKL